jgi:hypothetical protein
MTIIILVPVCRGVIKIMILPDADQLFGDAIEAFLQSKK